MEELRSILGDVCDTTLQALLARSGGDVAAAANAFFDGSIPQPGSSGASSGGNAAAAAASEDVLATLFKTLEDTGKKLAERNQQLDMTTRLCDALTRRLHDLERNLALADADAVEREEIRAAEQEAAEDAEPDGAVVAAAPAPRVLPWHLQRLFRLAAPPLLMPLQLVRWFGHGLGRLYRLRSLGRLQNAGGAAAAVPPPSAAAEAGEQPNAVHEDDEVEEDSDAEMAEEDEDEDEGEGEGEEEDEEDEDEEDEDEEDEDEDEGAPNGHVAGMGGMAEQAAEMMAALAAAQAAATARLQLPEGLLEQISAWERLQAEAESEWRLKQSRMNAEFEERKRRLQEQQLGTRKRLKEGCDQALRPLYSEGQALCAELAGLLVGRLCRMQECVPAGVSGAVARAQQRQMLQGPLARITAVSYGRLDQPLQLPHCPSRGAASVSTGVLVTLEKIFDRNGIPMLAAPDDPLVFHRLSRGNVEVRVPLRLLPARVCLLSLEEATAAMPQEGAPERVFVVRYAGGLHGGPIEPVQILPEGLSLSEYDISFAAGPSALRVEHRTDGPVKCRAEPAAQKQVFADSPVELYTQEVDEETHNIVQVYFSDLRDEVAVDVLNITGTAASLEDAECASFPPDATGAALNYKIIVRDARVLAVLYQEDEQVRSSPFIEHRLPVAGAYVVLPDDTLGVLQCLPRGLVVAREHRELPENAAQWPPRLGLRAKGKHPAELPGMVDVKVLQQDGRVAWPQVECSVPVCAVQPASASRLQCWHAQWDLWTKGHTEAVGLLADKMEALLKEAQQGKGEGSSKDKVSELTECYGELEEKQRELEELELGEGGVGEERLANLQRGIQRCAALARFG